MKINEVDQWRLPEENLRSQTEFVTEMASDELGFLCGIIKKVKPKKIVEVGVAEGGTTSVIMNAISLVGLTCEVYSVDLLERLYYNQELATGYEYTRLSHFIKNNGSIHTFLFGKSIAKQMQTIGKNIDMVILDTMHAVPGELMDFLSIYPYLSESAMVILHDINVDYYYAINSDMKWKNWSNFSFATKLLFSVVKAEKYLNYNENGNIINIGAFQVNEDTDKCIKDIFFLLHMPWSYCPPCSILKEYEELFQDYYDSDCNTLFQKAVNNGLLAYEKRYIAQCYFEPANSFLSPFEDSSKKIRIVIWGAGVCGKSIYKSTKQNKRFEIVLWIDTFCYGRAYDDMVIEAPHVLAQNKFDYLLIAVKDEAIFETIRQEILQKKWASEEQIMGPFSLVFGS